MKRAKQKLTVLVLLTIIVLTTVCYIQFRNAHTFTLVNESEQIQPVLGPVRVWGTQDTDVWFIDIDNPKLKFQIGYITPGMSETINLEKGKWYTVHSLGEITIRMVNVRIP